MASQVTRVVIGDYRYTLYDDGHARAVVTDISKSSYGALQTSVTHEGVTYALTSLYNCFQSCFSLATAPAIPNGVTRVSGCFRNCTSLTGTIPVNGTPTYYDNCFYNTTQPIVLVVTDASETPTWTRVAATGNNGNVTVRDVSANPAPTATVTAVRVLSSGSTTPDETGQYAYITVRTTASTEQAPDNVAQAPTITLDGSAYTPLQPSGTATFTCWVSLGNDLGHVIGATPRDTYKTGTPVTVTLASTYSPMEFHATPVYDEHGVLKGYIGGDGAAFGQHATRAGWLDVAWNMDVGGDADVHGDVSADGALSCADGSPYCSDGTNVVVGGTTVGSADNLSYVLQFPLFKVSNTDAVMFVNSDGGYSGTANIPAISGYTPVGVVGNSSSHGTQFAVGVQYVYNDASSPSGKKITAYGGWAKSGVARDLNLSFQILYVKSELIG